MKCPHCGAEGWDKVSQTFNMNERIRRRRKCMKCGKSFYTSEEPEKKREERIKPD